MGKGDIKTRRGKLFAGTFGVRRAKKKKNKFVEKHNKITNAATPKPKPEKVKTIVEEVKEPVAKPKIEESVAAPLEKDTPVSNVAENKPEITEPKAREPEAKVADPKIKPKEPEVKAKEPKIKSKEPEVKAKEPKIKPKEPEAKAEESKKVEPAKKKTDAAAKKTKPKTAQKKDTAKSK